MIHPLLKNGIVLGISALGLIFAYPAQSTDLNLFTDDFESDLSQWVGKGGSSHNGQIVTDPLDSGNQVLNFTNLVGGGDVFSIDPLLSTSGEYRLSFDYLGIAQAGSTPNNLGGFAGYSFGLPGLAIWLAGTGTSRNLHVAPNQKTEVLLLKDDGSWHSYEFTFQTPNAVRIMLEDFIGSGGIAGDAYFDNVSLEAIGAASVSIPEPSTSLLVYFGFVGLYGLWKRRIKS